MKKIKASEGMYLTQKSIENEGGRTFALSLYLADNDSEDNWREATQEEYYDWQRKQEERMEQAMHAPTADAATVTDGGTAGADNDTPDKTDSDEGE